MSGSAWGIVWLAIALKVPIIALLYLVWWAIKAEPVIGAEGDEAHVINWRPWRRPPGT